MQRCFACDKKLGKNPSLADTRDDQHVMVGSECFRQIKKSGEKGWIHPKLKGLRLWIIKDASTRIIGKGQSY